MANPLDGDVALVTGAADGQARAPAVAIVERFGRLDTAVANAGVVLLVPRHMAVNEVLVRPTAQQG